MKSNEKKMILIIMLVGVVIIGGILIARNSKNSEESAQTNEVKEEFVEILEDGTKLNISDKLKETKTFDGLEISNFQLTQKNNVTVLLGTITNKSSVVKGDYPIEIIILDKAGKEIDTTGGYIGELQPGQSTQLNCSASFDYANAYDFEIVKK